MDQSHANALILIEAVILSERNVVIYTTITQDQIKHYTFGSSIQMIAMRHM
jgi:hypothetical protein